MLLCEEIFEDTPMSPTTSGAERRQRRRYRFHLALAIDAQDRGGRVGISQDVSAEGLRFNTRSRFAPGEELMLTLHMHQEREQATRVRARVVRVDTVDLRSNFPWRYMTAVHFEEPVPDIEATAQKNDAAPL